MSRILVTGVTGFLGSAIVKQLQEKRRPVRTTARQPVFDRTGDHWPADLTTTECLPEMLEGVSCVIHCAGLAHQFDPRPEMESQFHRVNCEATLRLARAAADQKVKRFVFVSSVSVYGPARDSRLRNEDTPADPVGAYAESKRQAEAGLLQLSAKTGMEILILRMATLYGEGDPGNLGRLFKAIERGRFVMIGSGRNRKSLVHRDDAAAACVRAALHPTVQSWGIWNISGEPCTMREIVSGIGSAVGREPGRFSLPAPLANGLLNAAAVLGIGPIRRWAKSRRQTLQKWLADDAYDGSRFARDFQWRSEISLVEGLSRLADGNPWSEGTTPGGARAA